MASTSAACEIIDGNGVPKNETRDVGAFTALSLEGSAHVEARVGSPQSVVVSGDENIVGHMDTDVEDGTLRVHQQGGVVLNPSLPLVVRVTAPDLTALDLSGSSELEATGLHGASLAVDMSGSSSVRIAGTVVRLNVSISGSGECHARDLTTRDTYVSLSGSSNAEVCVVGHLEAHGSGSSEVAYSCDPERVDPNVSGSARVVRQ